MGLIEIRAVAQLGLESDAAPSEFRLLAAGWNDYADGKLLFDAEAAQSVMQRYEARGLELTADYEHQSLTHPPVEAPASAKRWVPELRGGELWATSIAWTKRAAQYISEGEYRYFSIAARVEPKTKRIVELINFGLTNLPAANRISPLMAASITGATRQEQTEMKTVLVALGLSAELEESAAVVEASRLAELKRDVLAITKKNSIAEAVGALRAFADAHAQVVALSAQLAAIEAEKRGMEFDALVAKGIADRKISPALAKGTWIAEMRKRDSGCVELKAYLAETPALVDSKADAPQSIESAPEDVFTESEIRVARAFVGDDSEEIAKRIREVRASNVNPLKGSK